MRISLRTSGAVLVAAGLIALAGCGGDEEKKVSTTPTDTAVTDQGAVDTATAPETIEQTDAATAPRTDTNGATGGTTSPEDQKGGAGDEVPNATQAELTGNGGRISPRMVSVPPFIAIRVVLRSTDGATYTLGARGRSLQAKGRGGSVTSTFDGIRAGERITFSGPQGSVVVAANAEPGP